MTVCDGIFFKCAIKATMAYLYKNKWIAGCLTSVLTVAMAEQTKERAPPKILHKYKIKGERHHSSGNTVQRHHSSRRFNAKKVGHLAFSVPFPWDSNVKPRLLPVIVSGRDTPVWKGKSLKATENLWYRNNTNYIFFSLKPKQAHILS